MKMPTGNGGHFYLPAKCGLKWADFRAELQEFTIRLTGLLLSTTGGGFGGMAMHTPARPQL